MLNRATLILRYKQPFVDWINAVDPSPASHTLTLAEVNQEHTVYLIEVEDEGGLDDWLARHHEELSRKSCKAGTRTRHCGRGTGRYRTLREWCSFELHTVVVDVGASPLEDDEFED